MFWRWRTADIPSFSQITVDNVPFTQKRKSANLQISQGYHLQPIHILERYNCILELYVCIKFKATKMFPYFVILMYGIFMLCKIKFLMKMLNVQCITQNKRSNNNLFQFPGYVKHTDYQSLNPKYNLHRYNDCSWEKLCHQIKFQWKTSTSNVTKITLWFTI